MKTHELKTDPEVFDAVIEGRKTFEIRRDDRGFEVGDELKLRKTKHTGAEMAGGAPLEYIGPPLHVTVTYILRGPIYGLAEGWVILGIVPRDGCPTTEVEQLRKQLRRIKRLIENDGHAVTFQNLRSYRANLLEALKIDR